MNRRYFLPLSVVLVLSAGSAYAQRTTPPSQPAATPSATSSVALPMSKIAVIDTEAFLDPKGGISQFSSVLAKLNGEFKQQKDALTQLQSRAQTLQQEITNLQNAPAGTPIDQRSVQTKTDQLDQLKKDIQRKGEDAQAAYKKRQQELFTPVQNSIGKALEAFAKARGINVIIDASQVPLLYAADNIDITRAFIADYNSKSPATAATTTPE